MAAETLRVSWSLHFQEPSAIVLHVDQIGAWSSSARCYTVCMETPQCSIGPAHRLSDQLLDGYEVGDSDHKARFVPCPATTLLVW